MAAAAVTCTVAGGATLAAECTCRAGGRDYQLGRTACLPTPQGFRLGTCGMVLNNTSWQISDTPCVGAARDPDRPIEAAAPDRQERRPDG